MITIESAIKSINFIKKPEFQIKIVFNYFDFLIISS